MFEIGPSLREARNRRQLTLEDVSRVLMIRTPYLQALEEERWDLFPGEAYLKGFLRQYASFLGLEGGLFVEEYVARYAKVEEPPAPVEPPRRRLHAPALSRLQAATGAAVLVAVGVVVLALKLTGGAEEPASSPLSPGLAAGVQAAPASPAQPASERQDSRTADRPGEAPVVLRLAATDGPCWLEARAGGERGRLLYRGTLEHGETLRLRRKTLWVRLGAPWNLEAALDGRPLTLPGDVATIRVTEAGARVVS